MTSDSKWRLPDDAVGFEDLCCLIAQEKYRDGDAQKYGRRGQKQFGVDIQAVDYRQTPAQGVVIQCKFKSEPLTFSRKQAQDELQSEFAEALASHLKFDRFIYACNIKSDTKLQDFAAELSEQHPCHIAVWSIDDIKLAIESSPKLAAIYTVTAAPADVSFYLYGEQKINKILNTAPVNPTVFIGREDELVSIHRELNQGSLLLLVNGEGGIGKTTLAAAYYHRYINQYRHLAWVYGDNGIADALLTLEYALNLESAPGGQQQSHEQRLERLIIAMTNLKQPCLLVVDNANALADLEHNYPAFRRLSNFHILLTSRVGEFVEAKQHAVHQLNSEAATALFCQHYPGHDESQNELLLGVFIAIGFNTLVIELLAKNLANLNRLKQKYSLQQLLKDLDDQGVTKLSQTQPVKTWYGEGNGQLRTEKPEDVIAAMYELANLTEPQQQLIAIFSVLPAEPIEYLHLEALLSKIENLEERLTSLQLQGWIEFNSPETTFKCSPVVQQVVRAQTSNGSHFDILVWQLANLLEYEGSTGHLLNSSYQDGALYARFSEYLFKFIDSPSHNWSILYERVGCYYQTTGDIDKALGFYHQKQQVAQSLLDSEPNNSDYKNSLAIAYSKLGDTYSAKGDLDKALSFYQKFAELLKQLHNDHPQQVGFKNGLAIAYSKLGETYSALGDLDKALTFYQKLAELFEQLHNDHPQQVGFKNGLAIAYEKLGDTYSAKGDLDKALKYYQLDAELSEQLHNDHPQQVGFKNGLAIAYSKLGETYSDKGDLDKALEYYQLDAGLSEQLHSDHPQQVGFKNGLAIAYSKLGDTYSAKGDLEKALKYYQLDSGLSEQLHNDHPQQVGFKNGLAIAYERLGDTYSAKGDLDEALKYYQDETELFKQLHNDHPQQVGFKNGLAVSLAKLGELFLKRDKKNDRTTALDYFKKAQKLWQAINRDCPGYAEYQAFLNKVTEILKTLTPNEP